MGDPVLFMPPASRVLAGLSTIAGRVWPPPVLIVPSLLPISMAGTSPQSSPRGASAASLSCYAFSLSAVSLREAIFRYYSKTWTMSASCWRSASFSSTSSGVVCAF